MNLKTARQGEIPAMLRLLILRSVDPTRCSCATWASDRPDLLDGSGAVP
ncbi:hypothetical protein [Alicyclobacillus dauci]|uniref:Uncharacterized protein n=1 Tax=Alicyclobacillus dauci TaxID=1475485 RepID=A0ABY6Z0Q0_9BACL|nr:hypothetical protein [Alicyclobacillus dauci]WAH36391.1 hypothetical protein NZD86_19530 [Alicyclobacillus dauci]